MTQTCDAGLRLCRPRRYLSLTSFTRDGTGVATPVWFVNDGRRLLALTDLYSAKIRRIHRNRRVLVAPCRADGKLRGEPVTAHAVVLTAPAELERVQKLVLARYKLSYIMRARIAYTPVGPSPIIHFLVSAGFGIGDVVQAGAMLGGIKARAESPMLREARGQPVIHGSMC